MGNGRKDKYISLKDILHYLPPATSLNYIFRVPNHLRRVNEKAYEPEVLAIGPYHHGKPNLRLMEEQKLWYLLHLLHGYEQSLDHIVNTVGTIKAEAYKCYVEPFVKNHKREFIEMMVLDGCFIIAMFLRLNLPVDQRDPNDPIFGTSWMGNILVRDLLLLENQLPLCVLYKLSEIFLINFNSKQYFVKLAYDKLNFILWGSSGVKFKEEDIIEKIVFNREIKHLLGLMHHGYFLSSVLNRDDHFVQQQPKWEQFLLNSYRFIRKKVRWNEVTENEDVERQQDQTWKQHLVGCVSQCGVRFPPWAKKGHDSSKSVDKHKKFIRCSKDLQEAGIKFKMAEESKIHHIHFKNRVLKIPTLRIDDYTNSLVRNFIAYEQFGILNCVAFYMVSNNYWPNFVPNNVKSTEFSPNFVGEYVKFMDCLINSENDVEVLRQCGLIENWLGDDEVVSNMFNRLGDFVAIDFPIGNYSKIFGEVNRHCSKRWNFHTENLRHKYFNSPWALISFLAAPLLLFLTLTQTVFAILSFAIPNPS